jgi:hypothetical protein
MSLSRWAGRRGRHSLSKHPLWVAALLLAACSAPSRQQKPAPPPQRAPKAEAAPVTPAEDGIALDYRAQAEGRTLVEVLKPDGAQIQIYDGAQLVAADAAPLAAEVHADHWYRITAHLPSGALREKKVQGVAGQVASLRFADTGVRGPVAMTREEFHRLLNAIDQEAGDKAKLSILETASARAWFTTAMAGVLLEHLVYRDSKLLAVPIVKDRILDKQNAYLLYQHFTYREDKAKVQEMLEH